MGGCSSGEWAYAAGDWGERVGRGIFLPRAHNKLLPCYTSSLPDTAFPQAFSMLFTGSVTTGLASTGLCIEDLHLACDRWA